MSTENEQFSIFDEIDPSKIVRSKQRRPALLIPLKKGKEMAQKIQHEIEQEKLKEQSKKIPENNA